MVQKGKSKCKHKGNVTNSIATSDSFIIVNRFYDMLANNGC